MYKIKKQLVLILIVTFSISANVSAGMPEFFDQPDTVYTSNVVTDILWHNGGIWFATDEGLNFSTDGGVTWYLYDNTNGLVSSSISAFTSIPSPSGGQRIWAATNHEERISEGNVGISDGVSYSDDNGLSWTQIDFESAPNDIDYVWGGDRTIFDITGHYDPSNPTFDDWVFFTAFAGGFLASQDGGQSWKRIFPTKSDSAQFYVPNAQPSLRNRYFSCAVDTSHNDSLYVWSGTAAGMFQYVFVEPKDKAFTKNVTDIEFCPTCPADDSSYVFYGGLEGFTRANKQSNIFQSKFVSDGLPGNQITAMLYFAGKLFVGTASSANDNTSTGLAISTDLGETFTAYNDLLFEGSGNRILDISIMNDNRMYMAVENNGLFVSSDTGFTWNHIFVDSSNVTPANLRNIVRALDVDGDTLNIGTDSGLVRLAFSLAGTIDTTINFVFDEDDSSSTRIIELHTQTKSDSSKLLWTVNVPLDTVLNLSTPNIAYSIDGGQNFPPLYNFNAFSADIGFIGDTAIVVGTYGTLFTPNSNKPDSPFPIYEKVAISIVDSTSDTTFVVIDSMNADNLSTIEVNGDTVIFGGDNGFAVSTDRGQSFNITRVNTERLTPDLVLNYTSAITGLNGDWVPALGIQYETTDPFARVWASLRPTFSGAAGISVGVAGDIIIGDDTLRNQRVWADVHDDYAWNFAFAGDTAFAATNNGLIYASYDANTQAYSWTSVELNDDTGAPLLLAGTPVYAVEVDDNYVWVGTGDRTVRLDRSNLNLSKAFYVVDPKDEVYAFPIPFSHVNNNAVDFHFIVKEETEITIEIYDFAMHLVDRVVDNVSYLPGTYPTAGADRRVWDGLNGKGDEVSIGMYYFKISYSSGEVHWGKIAVIP